MSNNAAGELRAVADLRRLNEGGRRAAAIYTLIATARLNDIDPQAWLADVLARLPDDPAKRILGLESISFSIARSVPKDGRQS